MPLFKNKDPKRAEENLRKLRRLRKLWKLRTILPNSLNSLNSLMHPKRLSNHARYAQFSVIVASNTLRGNPAETLLGACFFLSFSLWKRKKETLSSLGCASRFHGLSVKYYTYLLYHWYIIFFWDDRDHRDHRDQSDGSDLSVDSDFSLVS